MHLEVRNLDKHFGQFHAVQDVSFNVQKGHLIGLLGPSGGGKTSILRMLAGLESPDSGDIIFHGQKVNQLPPQEREIGFVFQNYALFKHMTVFDNIAFGLTVKKMKKPAIKERVQELVELTGLAGFEHRYPHQLSGGQRQRVAFARALAPEPQLLLLDEPFAAIDAKIRQELRTWLRELIERVGITSIFVTHDQDEAIEVADEIMIINGGRLEQKGTPWDIYKQPSTPFVASFIGESTIVDEVSLLKGFDHEQSHPGIHALIRPEYIEVGHASEFPFLSATEKGTVKHLHFRGSQWLVEVQVGQHSLITYRSLEKETLEIGQSVHVMVHRAYLFNDQESWIAENRLKQDTLSMFI
ncbi:sulfate ABC transporter ATP-binding protein [Paenibacillus sp. PK4536]|jgi:sulfate transport system ATP-binding protein|uniref:Carnitine transport ATP-binding protein OpuCA n=1 Tax=Paenibacillus nuruki TaxID=1886670 RepID=A0A1E3L4T3_9BACL|nr:MULTISPECIES: sulfate ABC transporter ATP-binding protein [Paenibacillus]ODP28768.1 Sulfate-transporting ATPase [Paenibacillus nuruki]TKJ92031.1 sulfate ABC transporter ATP-binding protein [Paenibacillus sp. CFBP13512]WIM37295.1 sulfate ABC transporter ATP-binding protein [Paenibacillus sp. PK4536]CAJ1316178.1 Sulfate-transporting ATPase [Paenibacillus nuruki]